MLITSVVPLPKGEQPEPPSSHSPSGGNSRQTGPEVPSTKQLARPPQTCAHDERQRMTLLICSPRSVSSATMSTVRCGWDWENLSIEIKEDRNVRGKSKEMIQQEKQAGEPSQGTAKMHYTSHKRWPLILLLLGLYLCKMQRCWVSLNACAASFHIRELLTTKAAPASPRCMAGWQGRKVACTLVTLVKADDGWADSEV